MFQNVKIGPLELKYYIPCAVIILIATYTGSLNKDIVGTITFLLMASWLFQFVGARIPIVRTWMGGAILLPLFAGAALVQFNLIPETLTKNVSTFMGSGFINIFLGAIIIGSILSMDRKLLLSATLRVLPCMLGSIIFVFIFLYLGCLVTGKSILEGMYMVGLPNYTGGSSGAIAVVPEIYSSVFNTTVGEYSGKFLVFMNISNLVCVIFASLLDKMGKKYPSLAGNGQLIKGLDHSQEKKVKEPNDMVKNIQRLGSGLFISCVILIAGNIMNKLLPQLNFIAWATIIVIIVKATGMLDDKICESTDFWQVFIVKNFLPFLITGIGIASLDLSQVTTYFTISNLIIIIFGVAGSIVGSLIFGKVFGFYPIEAMIGIGANMGNLGGSGAIAVLSTTNRMHMMPFAVIANRIGGALMVVIISLTVALFA